METLTAVQAHARIERDAETKANAEIRDVRKTLTPGRAVRQGDVYLVRCKDSAKPRGDVIASGQLVDGTTQGSRHVAAAPAKVHADPVADGHLPDCIHADALLGPSIVATDEFVVTHPEHAHVRCPAGVYQVVHQLDAATRQRVQD